MSQIYEGVVAEFYDQGDDKPMGVQFHVYAAILFIPRDHPNYKEWLALLQKSQKEGVRLRFAYEVEGQIMTFLEEAK